MFRLVIDFPLSEDEQEAIADSENIISILRETLEPIADVPQGGRYRLSRDEDRTVRNYLLKDEHGHATTKKLDLFDKST